MNTIRVLIVGGYGTVGTHVSEMLVRDSSLAVVIGGRSKEKACQMANHLGCDWRTIDLDDPASRIAAIEGMDIVINCFSGPFHEYPLYLPQACAARGIDYLDVAGSYEYADRFKSLNHEAAANHATLITALGVNPGICGLTVTALRNRFDTLDTVDVCFVIGARVDHLSVAQLKEMGNMMAVPAQVWRDGAWVNPTETGKKIRIGEPFNGTVYLGAAITRDFLSIPERLPVRVLNLYSGAQSMIQGGAMLVGIRMGLTRDQVNAERLTSVLKWMGRAVRGAEESVVEVHAVGIKNGKRQRYYLHLACEENHATAIGAALVCQQVANGMIDQHGAFYPPEVVDAGAFMEALRHSGLHMNETMDESF